MAAPSASRLDGSLPGGLFRLTAAGDGSVAALHTGSRVTLIALPSAAAFAEIDVDPEALGTEVAWVGTPPRLLVVSRYAAESTAHLIDPAGPHSVAEVRLDGASRLHATVDNVGLVISKDAAAMVVASEARLVVYKLHAKLAPLTAGTAGGRFLIGTTGNIEEWDAQTHQATRRMRLPRAVVISAVGGSDRLVWMTTQEQLARIDVIPLINRGQARAHDLPEPIARIVGHPRSDLVACVGAQTGKIYVIDLDCRRRLRILAPEGIERIDAIALVAGRSSAVIAAQLGRPIAVLRLDGREPEAAVQVPVARGAPEATAPFTPAAPSPTPATTASPEPAVELVVTDDAMRTWRDEVAGWYRSIAAGALAASTPIVPSIDALLARCAAPPALAPALVLMYGAHLCGERGAAPLDVATVLDRQWHEALGGGALAHHRLATYAHSRVALARPLRRMLDELPPATGTLFGVPGPSSLLGPCAVVAPADEPLATVAARCAERLTCAILVATGPLASALLEARVYGAVAMVRAPVQLPSEPVILVVDSESRADELGLPSL